MNTFYESIAMIKRNWVVSVVCSAVVFFAAFAFGAVATGMLWLSDFAESIGKQTCIEAYFMPDISEEKSAFLVMAAETIEGVEKVTYVSTADAVERLGADGVAMSELADMELLGLVPSSMEVTVKSAKDVRLVAEILEQYDGVDFVRFGDEITENILSVIGAGKTGCAFLLTMLALCTALSVSATTVLVAMEKRTDIETLRLIGADESFIAKPFVLQGFLLGATGAAVASVALKVMLIFVMASFSGRSSFISDLVGPAAPFGWLGCAITALGGMFGAAGSALAIAGLARKKH